MKNAFGRKPSASMIVAVTALVLSGTGTAIAARSLVNGDKLIAKQSLSGNRLRNQTVTGTQVNVQTLGKVPLAGHADSATSAQTAGHAATADTATNVQNAGHANSADTAASASDAAHLGGQPASAYQLAGGRGIAIAGAHVSSTGQVTGFYNGWFNTVGGAPTVDHVAGSGSYYLTFPGISDMSHYVIQTSLDGGPGQVGAGTNGGGAQAAVFTYDASGAPSAQGFYITIYGASNSG